MPIPKECRRLAEVDFPIAVVSKHAAREKSIRHGHPSTLHLWWARRPLAACRAMLLGLLLPDPCDVNCPGEFKEKARSLLAKVQGRPGRDDEDLRNQLLRFIGDFANWDLAANAQYLEVSRGLVRVAHGEEPPLVVDPFAGGGSIPLEALRLGCEAFASDLNPVACLILKVMLEDIPRHGPELAEELRRAGKQIKEAAEKALAEFYPRDPDGAKPIAYLWARTVRCEAPNCGAEIPLLRSFWLCKKANRRRALKSSISRNAGAPPIIDFDIFEPKSERDVQAGTVSRAKATCLACNMVLSTDRVRAQLSSQRGGADPLFDGAGRRIGGARILAVVALRSGEPGRHYRLPAAYDYQPIWNAAKRVQAILSEWGVGEKRDFCPVPDEPIQVDKRGNFWVALYGPITFGDLFSERQKLSLIIICSLVRNLAPSPTGGALKRLFGSCIDKLADLSNTCCRWEPVAECPRQLFTRQAIPLVWDVAEGAPIGESSGSFEVMIDRAVHVLKEIG